GGTDAHAKNYSMLIGAEGRARLAPLYDIASILPYDFDRQKVRLAMKIGDEYRLRDIGPHQWQKLAGNLRLDADALLQRVRDLALRMPDHLADVRKGAEDQGLDHPLVARLSDAIVERSRHCLAMLNHVVAAPGS